jgi:2-phosphoglycerate kinase
LSTSCPNAGPRSPIGRFVRYRQTNRTITRVSADAARQPGAPTLLMSGLDRTLARDHVRDQVKAVLDEWRHG